ncbi:hypothetical protein [Sphingomonas solaris]|uniref:Uncharacterized protein n=1 Tax=Alterirhizorhabdus solaris TaxID=2529389 RepID=A0A558R8C8_9SPHN|nr:hypothetical protein [Sphingomonas solaris]TVV75578.1 hypothetical protein FOY91_06875 [Sphingomonas solaris]
MAYAETTTVAVEKSIAEIIGLLKKAGAVRIGQVEEPGSFTIEFFLSDRRIRFCVILPAIDEMPSVDGRGSTLTAQRRRDILAQRHRQRARALLLVIKAKLESVESRVETFEQAFLANVVLPGGATVYDSISAPIADQYAGGTPGQLRLESGGR